MKPLRVLVYLLALNVFSLCIVSVHAQAWERFRAAYPYHIQTIALSDEDTAGHRTLIISVPPPLIALEDIQGLAPALTQASTESHRIGVDGWVKDVVVDLPQMPPQELRELTGRLQQRLFSTSYKAYTTPIPQGPISTESAKLDLSVTSGDLRSWLLGKAPGESRGLNVGLFLTALVLLFLGMVFLTKKRLLLGALLSCGGLVLMINASGVLTLGLGTFVLAVYTIERFRSPHARQGMFVGILTVILLVITLGDWRSKHHAPATLFYPIFGTERLSCAAILRDQKSGVYLSSNPGLVLWSFSKTEPLDNLPAQIREFVLDSDLIVGAVGQGNQVAVVARERATPVALLPPLRMETILQLAGAQEDELSQSYERKNPFAGRYDDDHNTDWAPIYLSPRLIDTEYGSLLNITDQLLKGWSTHGETRYVNFTYPEPKAYPFEKNLMEVLGTHELTFNWNTKGVGYLSRSGPYEVIAFNKTGALPIDYLAEGRPDVASAEDTAYRYYSELNDPNLVRVVQYAALYQIFHHFNITATATPVSPPTPVNSPLVGPIEHLVDQIASLSDGQIARIRTQAGEEEADKAHKIREGLRTLRDTDTNGSLHRDLVSALATRDHYADLDNISDPDTKKLLFVLMELIQDQSPLYVSSPDRSLLRVQYALIIGARDSRWIHTPSIVESQALQHTNSNVELIGGHNLSSQITVFEADESVGAGKAVVEEADGKRIVRYNPSDETSIGGSVRDVARDDNKTTDQIRKSVERDLVAGNRAAQPMHAALGFGDEVKPIPLRGFASAHAPGSDGVIGWHRTEAIVSDSDKRLLAKLSDKSTRSVLVARDSNGMYTISAPPAAPVQAADLASVTDAYTVLTGDPKANEVILHLKGFDERQAEGFQRNLESHTDVQPEITTTQELPSPEELHAILEGKYDFNSARVRKTTVGELVESGTQRELITTVDVPAREPGLKGLVLKIHHSISSAIEISQDLLSQMAASIQTVLDRLSGHDDVRLISRELAAELRKDKRFASVQVQIQHDDKTIFYVHTEWPSPKKESGIPA